MKIAIQMDPPEKLNPAGDSTLYLAREAQQRGYTVYYYPPTRLSLRDGEVLAGLQTLTLHDDRQPYYTLGEVNTQSLEEMDAVLIRQDPPYDMNYLSTTWMLEQLGEPLVLNSPQALRDYPEKLSPLQFPNFTPPTLISSDRQAMQAFRREMGEIVIKPLYGHGGHGVFHIDAEGRNFEALIEMMMLRSSEPLILQQFLPQVKAEEKRIVLIDGEMAGAFGRLPQGSEIRSNMRVGGRDVVTTLTPRQAEIVEEVAPFCKGSGFFLVGLDVIGDYLTEINVTSPTGLKTLHNLYGHNVAAQFWDAVTVCLEEWRAA